MIVHRRMSRSIPYWPLGVGLLALTALGAWWRYDKKQRSPPSSSQIQLPPTRYPNLCIDDSGSSGSLAGVEIILERTAGLGWGPSYTITLRGDGSVHYHGRASVAYQGRATFQIDPAAVLEILDQFDALDFFAIEHEDLYILEDASAETLILKADDRVAEFYNCWDKGPDTSADDIRFHESLEALARSIDDAVFVEQWIGTKKEREIRFADR